MKMNKKMRSIVRTKIHLTENKKRMYGWYTPVEILFLIKQYNLLAKDNVALYFCMKNYVKDGISGGRWFYFDRIEDLV